MQTRNFVDTRSFLSETKFYDGYSRYIEDQSRYETWDEAVSRVINMHRNYYNKNGELEKYLEEAQTAYSEQRVLAAPRSLQFGGEQLLKHQMRMYNCTSSYADRPSFFGEFFYILLCGAGAGFSVQTHHIDKLPNIKLRNKQAKGYVVEDSIEGWASALDVLLSSYFVGGGKYPEFEGRRIFFDLSQIRPAGSLISGGFKAPGPDGLRRCLDRVEYLIQGIVLAANAKETRLNPIHVYDICMHASDAVLSGGVRRSATICLFSPDDEQMMNAKTGNWFIDNPQRGRSNNSAVIVRDEVTKEQFSKIMESVKQFGEPGFYFVDSKEHTTNPCVEIGMFPQKDGESGWQGCNLTEINGGKCTTEENFYKACRAAAILGTLQAGYTDFKFIQPISKEIFDREALLGVSITGWMNNPDILFDDKILRKGAKIVKEVNKEVAAIIGINPAARTTCVKPSGNASVLLQTASGIHAEHSKMYIRNVQMTKESEISQALLKSNPYMVEDSVWSAGGTDYVISFPILPKKGSIYKDDLLGVKHLELVKKAQQNWVVAGTNEDLCADEGLKHNVSNTIIVDDWTEVENYVFKNRNHFAGISFLPMTGDKDYNQAPNTAVIDDKQMVKEYGTAAIFASGMVVDSLKAFDNLWNACATAQGMGEDLSIESSENALKRDWIRRFKSFSENYMNGDIKKTEYCLKDAYLLHKWHKIQSNIKEIEWNNDITEKKFIDVDTTGAAACASGECEIDF